MDPAEIRFIFYVQYVLKRKVRRFLEKSALSPSGVSPLKISRHLLQLLEIRILIANAAMIFITSEKY
jgi:hypothetical protein